MITFILGLSAAIVVGMFVWFTVDTIKSTKRIKQLEKQKEQLWSEIENRCNSIERMLDDMIRDTDNRLVSEHNYTNSRFDKFANVVDRDYVKKKNKLDNTIDYNN
jgi:hypothetical protein